MSSMRKTIRDAVKNAVVASEVVGNNVFTGRNDAIPENRLPAVCVYLGEEKIEPLSWDAEGRSFHVRQDLHVEAYTRKGPGEIVEERMDTLRDGIMTAVMSDATLAAAVLRVSPLGSQPDIDSEARTDIGSLTVTFDVEYIEARNINPESEVE